MNGNEPAEPSGERGLDDETAPRSPDQRSAEDEDLRESLAGLSRLASNRLPLEDLLTQVATYAVRAIPGADGEGRAGPVRFRPAVLLLDADVPPNTAVSGVTGLSEMSAVSRGVGIMIERGHHPDVAYDALIELAAAAGVATHVYAVQVLGC